MKTTPLKKSSERIDRRCIVCGRGMNVILYHMRKQYKRKNRSLKQLCPDIGSLRPLKSI